MSGGRLTMTASIVGAAIETISKLLGHPSPTITRTIYVGVIDEKKREAAALLGTLFVAGGG